MQRPGHGIVAGLDEPSPFAIKGGQLLGAVKSHRAPPYLGPQPTQIDDCTSDEGHTPHNVYPKPSWRAHLRNKWEELKPAGFAASFKEAEERLRELEAGDDGAALEPTRSSPTGLRDRASAATGQFVVDPGDDEGSISVASMGRGVRR